MNSNVEVIRVDRENTVKALRDQLQQLFSTGSDDSGFPILKPDEHRDGCMRMVGFIGASELEHALSTVASSVGLLLLTIHT
jgi:chloride channel 3/4/5